MKQFWPLSHEIYPAKVDQLKIFDDQKIQNAFCTSFFVLTPRITFHRTKIWTFQISSTVKMSKFEKFVRKGPFEYKIVNPWGQFHIDEGVSSTNDRIIFRSYIWLQKLTGHYPCIIILFILSETKRMKMAIMYIWCMIGRKTDGV